MKNFKNTLLAGKEMFMLFILVICSCNTNKTSLMQSGDFEEIFDGKTLNGWEGDTTYWRVEGGSLIGEVTPSTLLERNSFIIWRGGTTKDFELKAEYRISEEGNSGINYRSEELEEVPFALVGYQCDIDGRNRYTGMNYEERRRTTLASPGQIVLLENLESGAGSLKENIQNNQWLPAKVTGNTGDIDAYKSRIKPNVWNSVHVIVKGNRMQHFVNGYLMSEVTDEDEVNRRLEGLLGVQVHVGPPMKIGYKNVMLKHLE